MWMPFWLKNDHVFPGGLQCLSLAWGMNHLPDDSQGHAQDCLDVIQFPPEMVEN